MKNNWMNDFLFLLNIYVENENRETLKVKTCFFIAPASSLTLYPDTVILFHQEKKTEVVTGKHDAI